MVTYKQIFAGYREAFQWILPAHAFHGQTSIGQDPFNRAPGVGTGPFVFTSWSAGDSIEFDRNPLYREPGKPYLDQIINKITPSKGAAVQALQAGDLDAAWMLDESFIPKFANMSSASIAPVPWGTVEKLYLNTSCPSGPQQGDPACPHPILGDAPVRQAIALSLDKQAMAHNLLFDRTPPATSVIPVGPYALDLPGTGYDPDQARQLLDQAGWAIGSDGIRSKDGVRGHLSLASVSGDTFRAQEEQLIQKGPQDVGFEVDLRNVPGSVIANGFLGHSPLALGSFDLGLLSSSYQLDPQAYLVGFFGSAAMPNAQTQTGNNYPRMAVPQLDQALATAGSTLDDRMRIASDTTAEQLIDANAAVIPLYARLDIDARTNALQSWQPNGYDFLPWNAQNWWLSS